MSTKTLTLPLKAEYFNAIKSGEKVEEFRLCTPYWQRWILQEQQSPPPPNT